MANIVQSSLKALVTILLSVISVDHYSPPAGNQEACICTSGFVPVSVNVSIPVNPAEGLNQQTELRRLDTVYDIFGELCQPPVDNKERVQLLLHGATYTHQYWSFPINGFQNYSYVSHACARGQTTFSYDQLGSGLSYRPTNSTDVQMAVTAQIATTLAKKLKDGTLSLTLGLGEYRFRKVIALAHSQGSLVFNVAAITQPSSSSFDAVILTGHRHDPGYLEINNGAAPLARDVDPARWGTLDPGYISIPDRSAFYPPYASRYSSEVLLLDGLTKDVAVSWPTSALRTAYIPSEGFEAPITLILGALDQLHCMTPATNYTPCDVATVRTSERPFYPDTKKFTVIVREGSGHDLNLDFGAAETFDFYSTLAQSLV